VYIPLLGTGKVYPVINASGAAAKNVQIRTGARLTINSGYNLNVCGDLENQGTMTNNGTSSVTFIGSTNPVSMIGILTGTSKLTNVVVNKTNTTDTVKMTGNVEISGNFTITRGMFKAKGYNMTVGGNISNAGTYLHGNGLVEINGSGNSVVTKTGTGNYYNLKINKSIATRTVTFSTATTTIENQLDLTSGIAVTAGANELSVTNSSSGSVLNYSSSGYVNGRLRRTISGTNSYDFPVGDATRYELVNMNATSTLTGTSNILGFFTGSTPGGADPNLTEDGKLYEFVCQNGYWTLTPNAQPSGGAYNLTINPVGFVCQAPYQSVAKRTNSGAAWTFGGSTPVSGTQRNGFTSFSEFAQVDAEEPLPLNLLSFLGQWRSQKIRLDWKTANERDHSHFIVERAADGSAFEPIGRVNSISPSSTGNEYLFTDEHPGDRNQYRLKQVDNDGSFVYSHVVTLSKNGPDVFVQASPNPVTQSDNLFLNLMAGSMEEYQITITDITGKTVFSQTISTESGDNRFEIPFRKNFPKGVYTIRLIGLNENAADHHPIKLMVE
nr:T9SS type A sorting domain-containing protein [Catalimonadaceae bacterium]